MAWVYNPRTKKYEEVSDDTAASTPRYTGARIGTTGGGGSATRQAGQTPRNLKGAPTSTARGIMGLGPAPQMPTTKELAGIEGSGASGQGKGGKAPDPYASMLSALQKLSAQSQQSINQNMDTLTQTLQQQTNPYEDFVAQQTQTNPELTALLESQGVNANPLKDYATTINAQNEGQATAFQNLADTLKGIQTQNMQGMVTDAGQQRASLLNQLQGNIFGTGAKLMGKKNVDRNAIAKMLLASMSGKAK